MSRKSENDAQALQGVIVADSFRKTFIPMSESLPKALFPLVNIPMIEYAIEFLAGNGIQEIVIFCCAHADAISDYIKASKWTTENTGPLIKIICSKQCHSFGDAMREIDSSGFIRSDPFVLTSLDVIANVDLRPLIQDFRALREADSHALLQVLFKKAPLESRLRRVDEETLIAIDTRTSEILHYENHDNSAAKTRLPLALFSDRNNVTIHMDWMECGVLLCAPEVLFQFTDSFYESIQDLVTGVLVDEVSISRIYAVQIGSHHYAAQIHGLAAYDQVSKDIIKRWTHPIVPDTNFTGTTGYSHSRGMIYTEGAVTLAQDSTVGNNTVIARNCSLGSKSVVTHSVLGVACVIGNNVTIDGSYLWDGVVVEEGSRISRSLIGHGVVIRAGAVVGPATLIARDVTVRAGAVVKPNSRVAQIPEADADPSGPFVNGMYIDLSLEDREDGDAETSLTSLRLIAEVPEDLEEDESEEEDAYESFLSEVHETVARGIAENLPMDTVHLEINGLKFQGNHSLSDCCIGVLRSVLLSSEIKGDKKVDIPVLGKTFVRWLPLIKRFMLGSQEMLETLLFLEEFCGITETKFKPYFQTLVKLGYDKDIFPEEVVLSWVELKNESPPEETEMLQLCQEFITWLQEAEEESDEEE
eukprot:c7257_g1_i1.p1 GENE.c7257_g1_i1~~c7257_g1_i1.p1  ORF type:complete len:643 (+),score=178.39 c7257_g1_i1:69-1997(+)